MPEPAIFMTKGRGEASAFEPTRVDAASGCVDAADHPGRLRKREIRLSHGATVWGTPALVHRFEPAVPHAETRSAQPIRQPSLIIAERLGQSFISHHFA
jgi:hypothetical protein